MSFTLIFIFLLVLSIVLFVMGVTKNNSLLKIAGLTLLIINSAIFWLLNSALKTM